MFFLILLGRVRSEKNCAGFCRDLREFSRAVVGWVSPGADAGEWIGGTIVACRSMAGWRGGRLPGLVRQGFRGMWRPASPLKCTAFGLVGHAGCPQCAGLGANRARTLTVRMHSVSTGVGAGMSTSGIGLRAARASTLTFEIHSVASGFRWRISTSWPAHFVGQLFALTVRIHRCASGFTRRLSRSERTCRAVAGSHSPMKNTGLRVDAATDFHDRTGAAVGPRARLHR
ncbi:hypothetical protein BSTAB16_2702 [Burkholderia stabilis]|uniref:Uncharacterized protein n=1 Tax=Burkholderia stabilis TaxID=95485 RepID=A0AAJ5N6G7_9BURK|nr:hypothetical protein BSTAB16_2702 [Burkholderia stabilis]